MGFLTFEGDLISRKKEEYKRYCLKELDKECMNVEEIINIANKYKLINVLVKAYLKKGDILYGENNYLKAFNSYYKSLELNKDLKEDKDKACIYNKLGKCKIKLMDYNKALLFFNRAYAYALLFNDYYTEKNSIYNIALCYKKSGEIDMALGFIDKCIILCDKEDKGEMYIDIMVLKAICKNIKGEYKESIECLAKAEQVKRKLQSSSLCNTLVYKAKAYLKMGRTKEGEKLLVDAIELAKKYNEKEYILEVYSMLEDIYILRGDNEKLLMVSIIAVAGTYVSSAIDDDPEPRGSNYTISEYQNV